MPSRADVFAFHPPHRFFVLALVMFRNVAFGNELGMGVHAANRTTSLVSYSSPSFPTRAEAPSALFPSAMLAGLQLDDDALTMHI